MTSVLIVGLAFLGLLVAFLMVSFFLKGKLEPSQYNTLHFLTALCAGFAGGFLTGGTLLKVTGQISSGLKIGISGTAGFAMFILIWLSYPKRTPPPLDEAFHLSIPKDWTFVQAIQAIVIASNKVVSFRDFTDQELNLILSEYELHEKTPLDAIKKLGHLNSSIPPFSADLTNNTFTIKKL